MANDPGGFAQPTRVLGPPTTFSTVVSKVSAAGKPVFATQIPGAFQIYAIGTDGSGNVLVAGQGPGIGFPTTPGAWAPAPSGPNSSFACKLSAADGSAIFCTYLNSNTMSVVAITGDPAGNVYLLAERNTSPSAASPGALSLGNHALRLMKLDPTGTNLLYSAEFGGSGREGGTALSVDNAGNSYILGPTSSPDFPGAANGALPVQSPWFIAKIDPAGSRILYASYLRAPYTPSAIGLDSNGSLYVTGTSAVGSLSAIFALKFAPDGKSIGWESVLPPSGPVSVTGIAPDPDGSVTIAGNTAYVGFSQHLATSACRLMNLPAGSSGQDSFFIRLGSNGILQQSTFVGKGTLPGQTGGITAFPGGAFLAHTAGALRIGPDTTGKDATSIGCLSNAASFLPGAIAAGEIVSLFGEGLGPVAGVTDSAAGVEVTFDGIPAPLLYVQDRQINLVAPWKLTDQVSSAMCVKFAARSSCAMVGVQSASPGIFTVNGTDAAAVNQDGTLNSAANPAKVGSIMSLYLTGLGALSPTPRDGEFTQFPLPTLVNPLFVLERGGSFGLVIRPLEILYAGPAPLEISGLFQINFRVSSSQVWIEIPQAPGLSPFRSQLVGLFTRP